MPPHSYAFCALHLPKLIPYEFCQFDAAGRACWAASTARCGPGWWAGSTCWDRCAQGTREAWQWLQRVSVVSAGSSSWPGNLPGVLLERSMEYTSPMPALVPLPLFL